MSENNPLVSIIIPCYNCEQWLAQAIESCLRQSYGNIEVVLINDGSTDSSLQIIENFYISDPDVVRYASIRHLGPSAARNQGAEISRGEYLVFLDADDILMEDGVESLLGAIFAQHVNMAVGDWIDFTDDSSLYPQYESTRFKFPEDALANYLRCPWVLSAAMVKRNEIRWDEDFFSWEGVYYTVRLFVANYTCAHVDKPVTMIRQRFDADRVTIMHDHFNPVKSIQLFAWCKNILAEKDMLTFLRESVIDEQIVAYLYAAKRMGMKGTEEYFKNLNKGNLKKYYWYKRIGLSGFIYHFGPRFGLNSFFLLNKILHRA